VSGHSDVERLHDHYYTRTTTTHKPLLHRPLLHTHATLCCRCRSSVSGHSDVERLHDHYYTRTTTTTQSTTTRTTTTHTLRCVVVVVALCPVIATWSGCGYTTTTARGPLLHTNHYYTHAKLCCRCCSSVSGHSDVERLHDHYYTDHYYMMARCVVVVAALCPVIATWSGYTVVVEDDDASGGAEWQPRLDGTKLRYSCGGVFDIWQVTLRSSVSPRVEVYSTVCSYHMAGDAPTRAEVCSTV